MSTPPVRWLWGPALAVAVGTAAVVCLSSWALRLSPTPARVRSPLVFHDVTVVIPTRSRLDHRTVEVRDGKIFAIRPSTGAELRPGALQRFIVPGLIDMHFHLPRNAHRLTRALMLAHGVTTVRDLGPRNLALEIRRDYGGEVGPRIFTCGEILDGEPPIWSFSRVVVGADQARVAVRELAASGVDCIKVYDRVGADAMLAINSEAALVGLPVVGHVPFSLPMSKAGVADIQHLEGVANFVNPSFSNLEAEVAAWRELSLGQIEDLVSIARKHNIAHTPTLVLYSRQGMLSSYDELVHEADARLIPRFWRDVIWNPRYELGLRRLTEDELQNHTHLFAVRLERQMELVLALHTAGVPVHVGSDAFSPFVIPGVSVHDEIRLLHQAGLSREEALAAATVVPGEALPAEGLGDLRVGGPADFQVLLGDPTVDLGALEQLESVVVDGRLHSKEYLDRLIAGYLQRVEGWPFETASLALTNVAVRWAEKGDDTPGRPNR